MQLFEYEKENLKKVRAIAPECTLFLKKDDTFPLDAPCKIALFGSGARHTIKGGTGSGEVNSRFSITVERGLEQEGFEITTKEWLDRYDAILSDATDKFYKEIKRVAKEHHVFAVMEGMGKVMPEPEYDIPLTGEGDAAIYVLSRISGEGNDREVKKGDILLSDTEVRDILALNEQYDKFLLVLNVGGPVDLSAVENVKNILLLSQLGVVTGKTLARLVLGKDVPSGKLTTTWAKWEDYCTVGDFGDKNDTYYKEGIYVGYRYFDTVGKKAKFPFGFGLGYTEFELKTKSVSLDKTTVTVKTEVKNIGKYKGKEVVQVYVSVPSGKLDQPSKSLVAFVKSPMLKPSEKATLIARFDLRDLAGFDKDIPGFILEKGSYIVQVGNSSASVSPEAILELDTDVITRKVKNCLGDCGFEDFLPEKVCTTFPDDLPKLHINPLYIPAETVEYDQKYNIDPFVDILSDRELATLNTGAFKEHAGIAGVIGDACLKVAGAAGQTASVHNDPDFPILVMADGPAGVRLCKRYVMGKDGNEKAVGISVQDSLIKLMPKAALAYLKLRAKRPPEKALKYHYATAIPIGTALAQSFNVVLAKECGNIVGGEMERFGVHLWLAPALNIHRSIRCGRNFEYFSEDPLVSGLFAAAITNGVQKHPGCGTTIKHYAANNQETNRYNNNSHVSERAMREIYLKGFEICVKKSQPLSVMTSYNLLNGEHTSESRDLIENLLRSEFGFEGIVMTDWVVMGGTIDKTSIYRAPKAGLVAKAGGDLFMPGNKGDVESILEHLESGELSREQLKINCSRVYKMAKTCYENLGSGIK